MDKPFPGEPAFAGIEQVLAHALAMEREAAARYLELGERARDLGHEPVADLFLRLAAVEQEHERELQRRAAGLTLPRIAPGEYAWMEEGGPETAAHSLVLNLLTSYSALQIALRAEQRAKAFFESVRESSRDPAVAEMARQMAAEEDEHIARVQSVIDQLPNPVIDWEAVLR